MILHTPQRNAICRMACDTLHSLNRTFPTMPDTTHKGGGRKGYTPDDYRDAVEETGSIKGAARELDVNYRTAYDMCKRHQIYVPSLEGPPKDS